MLLLALLSGFLFGGSVDSLGNPEYAVREAAQRRLAAAGWLAAPALRRGLDSDCPERAERAARLWGGLPRLDDAIVKLVLATPPRLLHLSDEQLLPIGERLCVRVAQRGGCGGDLRCVSDLWEWVQKTPYRFGSEASDLRFVIECYWQREAASAATGGER